MLKKLLRWLKPKSKTLISELSTNKLKAGTLTATMRVADMMTGSGPAMHELPTVPAYTLAENGHQSHGKTVSWWSLVDGRVAPQSMVLDHAWVGDDTSVVYLEDHNGDRRVVGTDTLVHLSSEPIYET